MIPCWFSTRDYKSICMIKCFCFMLISSQNGQILEEQAPGTSVGEPRLAQEETIGRAGSPRLDPNPVFGQVAFPRPLSFAPTPANLNIPTVVADVQQGVKGINSPCPGLHCRTLHRNRAGQLAYLCSGGLGSGC